MGSHTVSGSVSVMGSHTVSGSVSGETLSVSHYSGVRYYKVAM